MTLREMRIEKGLAVKDVAQLVGVSAPTVSRWENGNIGNMRRDRIAALANALGVSPIDIIDATNPTVEVPVHGNGNVMSVIFKPDTPQSVIDAIRTLVEANGGEIK